MAQDLSWDDLRVFLAIVRSGSLTQASSALGVNASTVHRRLGALEKSLQARLFDRDPTGLTPTAAGEAMVPLAEQVETDVLSVVRSIAGHDQAPEGPVRLTAPESLLPVLVETLASFRSAYPAIDLTVQFADRYFDLTRREADIAVRPSLTPPEDAVGRRVATVAWAVYAQAGTPSEGLPWATYTEELQRLAASAWWEREHAGDPVLLGVNSVPAMHTVVACSPCRGLLPCFVGDADPTLVRITPILPEAGSALWLLVHPDLRRAARIRVLLDTLWQALSDRRDQFEGRQAPGG